MWRQINIVVLRDCGPIHLYTTEKQEYFSRPLQIKSLLCLENFESNNIKMLAAHRWMKIYANLHRNKKTKTYIYSEIR